MNARSAKQSDDHGSKEVSKQLNLQRFTGVYESQYKSDDDDGLCQKC